jgi:hypothetical protein
MADTNTANYGWIKPDVGASDDTWGSKLNIDLDDIDSTVKAVSDAAAAKLGEAPNDGATYGRKNAAWAPVAASVVVSDTPPVSPKPGDLWWDSVGGQLYVWFNDGNSSQWVVAVNQTGLTDAPNDTYTYGRHAGAWAQVATQASLGGYLPLTGGTLSGPITAPSVTATNATITIRATASTNPVLYLQNTAGTTVGNFFWLGASSTLGFQTLTGSTNGSLSINSVGLAIASGSFSAGGSVDAIGNFMCRQGKSGATPGYTFNFNWTGSALQAWIDTTNIGVVTISSDYRVKKDVAPLGSTWDRVKALAPVSYTHKDYTPEGASERLIQGDDRVHWGFIAHELQDELIASAATGVKDAENLIQSPNPWTVIAALTKALQEAMGRIEALEAAR